MSDINLDFTVSNNQISFTVEPNEITITPTDIELRIFGGGVGLPGGSIGELQYNDGDVLNGIPTATYDGSNLSLGPVSNLKISGGSANYALLTDGTGNLSWASIDTAANANFANYAGEALSLNCDVSNVTITGGTNGYVLQTDGTGNLSWTAQTGGGGGNGVPGGSNTQIQYNDSGSFGGNAGFTFNEVTGNVNLPTNLIVADKTTTSNLEVGTTANLGAIGNVKISGGANNYSIITDGAGNLSFAPAGVSATWTTVANIGLNDIFMGVYTGSNTAINAGSNVTITTPLNANSWVVTTVTSTLPNGIGRFSSTDTYAWGIVGSTESNVARSIDGVSWTKVATPFIPNVAPLQANNRILIWQSGSNRAAYSTDNGVNWTNANTVNTTLNLGQGAYGSNTVIIVRSESLNNNFIRSTDFGSTWANINTGELTFGIKDIAYGNGKFMAIARGTGAGVASSKITSDFGNTWSNITVPTANGSLYNGLVYGNGKWVAVAEYTGPTNRGLAIVSTDDGNTWTQTFLSNVGWQDVTYANGYFVATNNFDSNIAYSTTGTSWSYVNTGLGASQGGSIAYNGRENLIVVGSTTAGGNVASALTPKIVVYGSDGNISNTSTVPNGTYKLLGGSSANVGAMWIKTA